MPNNVAIDGPAGAGKSTVARSLAQKLGYLYIDTGAMYRALTYKAIRQGVNLEDEETLGEMARETEIILRNDGNILRVLIDGIEVGDEIRQPEVSKWVSLVAKNPGVRKELVAMQRRMAIEGGVVMDGRDIGTYVLPEANHKFFLTADLTERARRRQLELFTKGYQVSVGEVEQELNHRDEEDSTRVHAPLVRAEDAIVIDTTDLQPEEVVQIMLSHIGG